MDAEADAEEVVSDLEGLLQHVSGLGEALGLYNQYLALFEAPQDDLSTLALAEKEANSCYQVLAEQCVCHWLSFFGARPGPKA
jgi:hypothetical protein